MARADLGDFDARSLYVGLELACRSKADNRRVRSYKTNRFSPILLLPDLVMLGLLYAHKRIISLLYR